MSSNTSQNNTNEKPFTFKSLTKTRNSAFKVLSEDTAALFNSNANIYESVQISIPLPKSIDDRLVVESEDEELTNPMEFGRQRYFRRGSDVSSHSFINLNSPKEVLNRSDRVIKTTETRSRSQGSKALSRFVQKLARTAKPKQSVVLEVEEKQRSGESQETPKKHKQEFMFNNFATLNLADYQLNLKETPIKFKQELTSPSSAALSDLILRRNISGENFGLSEEQLKAYVDQKEAQIKLYQNKMRDLSAQNRNLESKFSR